MRETPHVCGRKPYSVRFRAMRMMGHLSLFLSHGEKSSGMLFPSPNPLIILG